MPASSALLRLGALSVAVVAGCGGGSADDVDTESETGSGTEDEIDTTWDGGPLTDCPGATPPGMVCVPGGTYPMGCMPYDIYCEEDELPLVAVTLSPFWVDVYETTYEDLLPFLNTLEAGYIRYEAGIFTEGFQRVWANYASICLSDEDEYYYSPECSPEPECNLYGNKEAAGGLSQLGARMYCEWLGKRLPTEAQWEAAARGQTQLIYPCSSQHLACWFGKYGCGLLEIQAECYWDECCLPEWTSATADCPSQWGAVQMCGNAAEWVLDRKDYANNDGHDWCADGCTDPEPQDGKYPIAKGGGTLSSLPGTRISAREMVWVNGGAERDTGVRCVLPASDRSPEREER